MDKFKELLALNVNDKTEVKDNGKVKLTYLSWAWAWAEFKKIYPDATYEIKKFKSIVRFDGNEVETELPYMFEPQTGYMVMTSVTAGGLTYDMWLPVMDGNNNAMKNKAYEYTTKYGKKTVEPADMFDVNKAIMRCLVKNLAMFGLGLYIYAGEDLPEPTETSEPTNAEQMIANAEKIFKAKRLPTLKQDLEDLILSCNDSNELTDIYHAHEKEITSDPKLLDLITARGDLLGGVA